MKRTAVSLFVCFAIGVWAAPGHAKKGGGAKAAPAETAAEPAAAEEKAGDKGGGDDKAAAEGGEAAAPVESLETDENKTGAGIGDGADGKPAGPLTKSWQDIVVVPRKAFLKGHRFEFAPFTGTSINDNLIRHYVFGLDLNFFLTDVLSIGVQGQYYVKSLTEREELVGLQYNRVPTLNHYLYGASFNFGYVPIYGKFAMFNKSILHWEIYASAGIGWTRSEIIPRNPGSLAWTNDLLTPNVGLGARFFTFDWLTLNIAIRDYIFPDKFEPLMRDPTTPVEMVKANATSELVNNIMVYVGVGMYLPAKFQYKTAR